MIDLLIAGAGPVGLVTAIHAAQAGLEVAVIEPRSGTIDKACGEGLMPQTLDHLRSIGVDAPGRDFVGIRYISDGKSVDARFKKHPGRGVRRTVLHEHLKSRAIELNVPFIDGKVSEINQSEHCVQAAGIRSRYLIGADGLHSTIRNQLNLDVAPKSTSTQRFGLRQHFCISPWSDFVEVYWSTNAEIYVTPVDDQTVGIAVLGTNKIDFWKIISQFPKLNAMLSAANPASKLRGAGPLRQVVRARTLSRSLLVGDASGYVDALTGEGMRIGFEEGKAAVNAVLANDPSSYEKDWLNITRSYRLLAGGLLWASSQRFIRPLIVPTAVAFPRVFRQIVNTLG
jgi:flavin-dependent dehydrogenase